MLHNMFNSAIEQGPHWDIDIQVGEREREKRVTGRRMFGRNARNTGLFCTVLWIRTRAAMSI